MTLAATYVHWNTGGDHAVTIWEQGRRLTGEERLWLAVLDQACADCGARNARVRLEAAAWFATGAWVAICELVDVPLDAMPRLRAGRGGLRASADGGGNGRHFGVRCGARPRDQYQYRGEIGRR